MKIKFYCDEIKGYTLFQVVEQSGIKRGDFKHIAPNGVVIQSTKYPDIQTNTIYIQGLEDDKDEQLVMTRSLTKNQIIEAFKSLVVFNEPQKGDIVKVRQNWDDRWEDKIYLCTIEGALSPYICVQKGYEEAYENKRDFLIQTWSHMETLTNKYKQSGVNEYDIEWE